MNKDDTKQAIIGFMKFAQGITGNKDLKIPEDIAKEYGIEQDDTSNMAIKELEQEPCGDAISRQAAIDAFSMFAEYESNRTNAEWVNRTRIVLSSLPSVTPKQSGWHYTDLPPSDDPYKRYLVVYSPYDRNYGRNTAPRFEIADYYKGDGLYNDKPWHLTISHSVMEKEILAWKDIGIVDEVMQGAKMVVEPQESDHKCHTCKHYTSGEDDGSCGSYICKGYSNWESEE